MSENILSIEDLKFLENLYFKHGINSLRYDDNGIKTCNNQNIETNIANDSDYLSEISRKLKFRLNSNFQLNFKSGFHLDVVRI